MMTTCAHIRKRYAMEKCARKNKWLSSRRCECVMCGWYKPEPQGKLRLLWIPKRRDE